MRRLFPLLILLLIVCVFLISCTPKDEIYIKGNIEETIEVYTEFIDPGVSYPKNYTLVVEGNIDNTILEKQHIKYFVYSPDGELIKELHRFVNVVDSTPPTYFENTNINDNEYYVGKNYNLFDFISNYEDNYVNPNSITVEPVDFSFKTAGEQEIIINFIDTFGNKSTFSKHINVVIDHTPPSYIEDKDIDKTIFYTGTIYYANDFISHYEDNYDSIEDIKVIPSQFVFTNQGVQEISIVFLDTWGNKSTFTKKS